MTTDERPDVQPGDAIADPGVAAVFAGYPAPLRTRLLALRALILEVAAETEGVGPLEETLKWGQPSYLTPETRSGSTVRIDAVKGEPARFAAYFHCQSGLVESFRALYPGAMRFEGNRAIVFGADEPLPEAALRHCIALALTHHLRKRKGRRREGGPQRHARRSSQAGGGETLNDR